MIHMDNNTRIHEYTHTRTYIGFLYWMQKNGTSDDNHAKCVGSLQFTRKKPVRNVLSFIHN